MKNPAKVCFAGKAAFNAKGGYFFIILGTLGDMPQTIS
jgi:hypothetical protein